MGCGSVAAGSSTNSAALQSSSDSPMEEAGSNRQYRSESPRGSVGLTRDGPASNLGSCEDRIALSSGALARWPLCSPGTSFPFTVGPRVRIRLAPAVSHQRTRVGTRRRWDLLPLRVRGDKNSPRQARIATLPRYTRDRALTGGEAAPLDEPWRASHRSGHDDAKALL